MVEIAGRHLEAVQTAIAKGVRIALGIDVATSGADQAAHWGQNADGLPLLVNAGMTPLQAIEAATANGPGTLGPRGPRSGQLAAGDDADMLGLTLNPLDDIALTDRATISWIWKDGQPVKSNGTAACNSFMRLSSCTSSRF